MRLKNEDRESHSPHGQPPTWRFQHRFETTPPITTPRPRSGQARSHRRRPDRAQTHQSKQTPVSRVIPLFTPDTIHNHKVRYPSLRCLRLAPIWPFLSSEKLCRSSCGSISMCSTRVLPLGIEKEVVERRDGPEGRLTRTNPQQSLYAIGSGHLSNRPRSVSSPLIGLHPWERTHRQHPGGCWLEMRPMGGIKHGFAIEPKAVYWSLHLVSGRRGSARHFFIVFQRTSCVRQLSR